jgi:hypothetical protein
MRLELSRRAEANRQLDDILSRVKYIGPQPEPSEEEVMDMVVDEVCAMRANQAKTRLCRYSGPRKA